MSRARPAARDGFADFLREVLAPLGHVSVRRMFGARGVFCDGLMFALVSDDTLFLRVDDANRAAFAEAGPDSALRYSRSGAMVDLPYWRVPDRLMDEPDALLAWAREALAAARRVSTARRKPASRRRSPAAPV